MCIQGKRINMGPEGTPILPKSTHQEYLTEYLFQTQWDSKYEETEDILSIF